MDFYLVFFFLIGLCVGSFLNVVIYRYIQGMSPFKPVYSFCPHCKTRIKWYHNIPIVSYLLLKGRCAYCGAPISIRYPLVEFLTGCLFAWLYLKIFPIFGWKGVLSFGTMFVILVPIGFIDTETKEIPDFLNYALIFSGWLLSLTSVNPVISGEISVVSGLAGIGLLFLINDMYYMFSGRDGIGMGDFKLMGGIGAFLGYKSFYYILLIASFLGIFSYLTFLALGKVKGKDCSFDAKTQLPFGPFLALASLIYVFLWI